MFTIVREGNKEYLIPLTWSFSIYLPSAVFIAQVLVGPSKQLKQIIQTEHNIVKAGSH